MILDDLLKNPTLRRVLAAGEEGVSRVVGRVLSSQAVSSGLRQLAGSAREAVERGVRRALDAVDLPSREDLAALERKLEELESMIDGLAGRRRAPRPPEEEDPSVPPDV